MRRVCSIAIITINRDGRRLAKALQRDLEGADIYSCRMSRGGSLKALTVKLFNKYDGLIFISALGIVNRIIGPLVRNKLSDPAVVAIDTAGRFAISALSGHEGGANNLAYAAAASLGATPVVTTGKETHKKIIVGIGCRRGVSPNEVERAVRRALREKGISPEDVRVAATVDIKKGEKGLIKACSRLGLPLVFIPKDDIKNFKTPSTSEVVRRNIGLDGVCEPAALLAGRRARLISKKKAFGGIAIAIAREG